VILLVYNAQRAIIVLKDRKHLLLALLDHIVLKEQVITSNSSALKVTSLILSMQVLM